MIATLKLRSGVRNYLYPDSLIRDLLRFTISGEPFEILADDPTGIIARFQRALPDIRGLVDARDWDVLGDVMIDLGAGQRLGDEYAHQLIAEIRQCAADHGLIN